MAEALGWCMAAFAVGFGWGTLWDGVVNLIDRATD
jgi:hypothetical protein